MPRKYSTQTIHTLSIETNDTGMHVQAHMHTNTHTRMHAHIHTQNKYCNPSAHAPSCACMQRVSKYLAEHIYPFFFSSPECITYNLFHIANMHLHTTVSSEMSLTGKVELKDENSSGLCNYIT